MLDAALGGPIDGPVTEGPMLGGAVLDLDRIVADPIGAAGPDQGMDN
ncbi:MAG: hypothetical protein WDO24_26870 [Pseudomonadota bacterium]